MIVSSKEHQLEHLGTKNRSKIAHVVTVINPLDAKKSVQAAAIDQITLRLSRPHNNIFCGMFVIKVKGKKRDRHRKKRHKVERHSKEDDFDLG